MNGLTGLPVFAKIDRSKTEAELPRVVFANFPAKATGIAKRLPSKPVPTA